MKYEEKSKDDRKKFVPKPKTEKKGEEE